MQLIPVEAKEWNAAMFVPLARTFRRLCGGWFDEYSLTSILSQRTRGEEVRD